MVRLLVSVVSLHTHARIRFHLFMNSYDLCGPCPGAALSLIDI